MKKYLSVSFILILCMALFAGVVNAAPAPKGSGLYKVVGGIHLYAEVQGTVTANPTVVFISGYGDDHTGWADIQAAVSQYALTVSYDRAGLGLSEDSHNGKDFKQQAKELHKLLKEIKAPKPYLLVGHSIGGTMARVFADQFKNETAGIVFIDSSHEDQNDVLLSILPEEEKELYMGQFTAEGDWDTVVESMEQVKKARQKDGLRNKPVTVIASGLNVAGLPGFWDVWQEDIASLSNNSDYVIAEGASHYVHVDQPQLVIDKIVDTLARY